MVLDVEGGAELTASDDEVREALEEAAEAVGESVENVKEGVEHILSSGTGAATNEAVAGTGVSENDEAETDPRLEAIELYKLRRQI
jgi:hypothetical protein